MACGVPCIVTDVGDSAYIVANTGISVPRHDLNAFTQALGYLLETGAQRRQALGQAARRRIETEFALPEITRRYGDLYRNCLGNPHLPQEHLREADVGHLR